jgi:hypothetical protein
VILPRSLGSINTVLHDKIEEYDIINEEIKEYSKYHGAKNIVFMNMSINNNVTSTITAKNCKPPPPPANTSNSSPTSSSSTDEIDYCKNIHIFLNTLKGWCDECNDPLITTITNLLKFWGNFVSNVTENTIPTDMQSYCDSILINTIDKANVQISKEVCRLIMFCYISLIMYFLSIHDAKHEYILLYHCKSGQDRTGTFYAINQMVNEVTNERYADIIADIANINNPQFRNYTFVDIYDKYFSPKPKPKPKTETETEIETERIDNLYNIIFKHLLFSYYVNLTSTGFPGIKWSLGQSTENRFSYLLLRNAEDARAFEGASMLRGA